MSHCTGQCLAKALRCLLKDRIQKNKLLFILTFKFVKNLICLSSEKKILIKKEKLVSSNTYITIEIIYVVLHVIIIS